MVDEPVDHQYIEVSCQRPVINDDFPGGLQDFNFSIGRPTVAFMDKSYMRFQLEVTGPGAAVPKVADQIALAEGCVANMYNNAIFKAGGVDISSITSFFPQVSAVERRTSNSGAWLDKIGMAAYGYNGDRSSRVAAISQTVNASQVGIPLAEGKSEIYRPTDGKTPDTANVALAAATGIVTGTTGTLFAATDVGSDIVIEGQRFQLKEFTDATHVIVKEKPIADIAAKVDWYLCRRNLIRSTQGRNVVQVLWKPAALGIFRWGRELGSGQYTLQLNPDPNYKMTAIEYPYSTATKYGPLTAGVYSIAVKDVKLYVATAKMSIPDSVSTLRLTEFVCQSKPASSGTNENFQWTVPSSTKALYMFLQDASSGNNPIIPPSVFRVYGSTAVAGTLPASTGEEQSLTQIQISYANITKPPTRWTSEFSGSKNYLVQLFMQSLIENGLIDSVGGAETMDQWLERGPLYCWRFERDAEDRSTEVQTQISYGAANWQTANLFLCAEYTRATEITTNNGQIVNVRSLNI